jgi:DNA-binding response OmpR family regulator
LKILIVDDDNDAADSLAELFEMEGHSVQVAYSGEAAVEAYRKSDFDLAFMDIMMPGKNGVESFFEIRKLKPSARVYMMTGYSVDQLIMQAIDQGALGVLSKPIDLDKVLAAIEEVKPAGIVLVAEDDPLFGPHLCDLVRSAGFECALVRDGQEALQRMAEGGIGVLILDLKLPIIDGLEVYARLRREHRQVPTIIITGHGAEYPDLHAAMQDMNVTGVLNKPFDPQRLLDQLHKLAA